MAGQDVFAKEDSHPWVLAVSLRILEAHLSRCCAVPGQASLRPALWMNSTGSGANVTAPSLLKGLEALIASDRLEREPTNAPLGVRALCSMTRLLLLKPDLMPEGSWEEDGGEAK